MSVLCTSLSNYILSIGSFQGAASHCARLCSDGGALHVDAVHVFALEAQHLQRPHDGAAAP